MPFSTKCIICRVHWDKRQNEYSKKTKTKLWAGISQLRIQVKIKWKSYHVRHVLAFYGLQNSRRRTVNNASRHWMFQRPHIGKIFVQNLTMFPNLKIRHLRSLTSAQNSYWITWNLKRWQKMRHLTRERPIQWQMTYTSMKWEPYITP